MSKSLRYAHYDGEAIPDDVLRELWRLRLEFLTLARSEDEDWLVFSNFVRGSERCLFAFFDELDQIQGFFTLAYLPMDLPKRRLLLIYSKYFYFRPAFRGHHQTMMASFRVLPMAIARYGWRSLHFVATTYPQSYVSIHRGTGRVWSLRERGVADWQRTALTNFALTFCADHFDAESGLVLGSSIADSESISQSVEARRLYAKYEALNPHWRTGATLPIIFSVNSRTLFHSFHRTLRRVGRHVQRR